MDILIPFFPAEAWHGPMATGKSPAGTGGMKFLQSRFKRLHQLDLSKTSYQRKFVKGSREAIFEVTGDVQCSNNTSLSKTSHNMTKQFIIQHPTRIHHLAIHLITVHHRASHNNTSHNNTSHNNTSHNIAKQYMTNQYIPHEYISVHHITQHPTTIHHITIQHENNTSHNSTSQNSPSHNNTSHHTASHHNTLHKIPQQCIT